MPLIRKTSSISALIISGTLLISCSSNKTIEPAHPISSASTVESTTSVESAFNNHINNLIRQLGDYDIKKQETAQQELMSITDNLSKSVVSNPDYNSPELDYLISALEYASKNGCPPGADVMSTVNAAVQIRAEKLYATVKYSGIIHPDLVKLHPEIMTLFQSGEYKKIMDWLSGQTEEIRKKAVQFYKYAVKSTVPVERNEAIKSLIKLG